MLDQKYVPQPAPFALDGLRHLALTWEVDQAAVFVTIVADVWISVLYPRELHGPPEQYGRRWPELVTVDREQLGRPPVAGTGQGYAEEEVAEGRFVAVARYPGRRG